MISESLLSWVGDLSSLASCEVETMRIASILEFRVGALESTSFSNSRIYGELES